MKIEKLLMDIRNKEFKLESGLEIKKYLPMEVKKTIAQSIIYDCTSDEGGVIKVDSVERYMSYVRHMITTHTNLEYKDENYDALCLTEYSGTTLLNAIMNCFEADAKECTRILDLVTNDLIYENSIEYSVSKFLSSLNNSLESLAGQIGDKIKEFKLGDIVADGTNLKSLKNIMDIISK